MLANSSHCFLYNRCVKISFQNSNIVFGVVFVFFLKATISSAAFSICFPFTNLLVKLLLFLWQMLVWICHSLRTGKKYHQEFRTFLLFWLQCISERAATLPVFLPVIQFFGGSVLIFKPGFSFWTQNTSKAFVL